MDSIDTYEVIEGLQNARESVRKMAAFKLSTNVGVPAYADAFITQGGAIPLRDLTLRASGNTLSYCLNSVAKLLELDKGWEFVNIAILHLMVELIVNQPLVNILRGAMAILASTVSYPRSTARDMPYCEIIGFQALKPAIANYPQLFEILVDKISSVENPLCGNALQLINSIMRDAIVHEDEGWSKVIKHLQGLGLIEAVFGLMQNPSAYPLAENLLDFQDLTKLLLRKWYETPIDWEIPEHKRALRLLQSAKICEGIMDQSQRTHNPASQTDSPGPLGSIKSTHLFLEDFDQVGYLGLLDLVDYAGKNINAVQDNLQHRGDNDVSLPLPIAQASLAVTSLLLDYFEVRQPETNRSSPLSHTDRSTEDSTTFVPWLLQWSIIHTAGLTAFSRLWYTTMADCDEFDRIRDLIRTLFHTVLQKSKKFRPVHDIQREMNEISLLSLRQSQIENMEVTYDNLWSPQLVQIKEELSHEAVQFAKEQRIRCLLNGAWFFSRSSESHRQIKEENMYRFAKLSHNRRYLHFAEFSDQSSGIPDISLLTSSIDLSLVDSVIPIGSKLDTTPANLLGSPNQIILDSRTTLPGIALYSNHYDDTIMRTPALMNSGSVDGVKAQLILQPMTDVVASEWLDGLSMLLNMPSKTKETDKLVETIRNFSIKIRLLNVRFDEMKYDKTGPKIPSREELDEDYWYDNFTT